MTPPAIAVRLLRAVAPPDDAEFIVQDLAGEFACICGESGYRTAARWYWRQTLASVLPLLASRVRSARDVSHAAPEDRAWTPRLMVTDNIRHTWRLIRRSPGVATAAILTLALGIGANAAVFSVVDAVLLHPLAYAAPAQLVSIWETKTGPESARRSVAPGDLFDIGQQNRSFADLASYVPKPMLLTNSDPPEQMGGELVSWNLFPLLGVQPVFGRAFTEADGRPGAEHVVIISDAVRQGRFGAEATVLGRTLVLNGESYIVIGVMPPKFRALTEFNSATPVAFFVPAAFSADMLQSRDHLVKVVARLRPAVAIEHAQRDLDRISDDIERRFPGRGVRIVGAPLDRDLVGGIRTSLLVIMGAVAMVALIACVNVANLLIVWAMDQRREVAIRLAMGASRGQIVVGFLIRSGVLALLGSAAGVVVAKWTRDVLVGIAPPSLPHIDGVFLNWRVLTVTAGLAIVSGIVAGVLPALQVVRRRVVPTLRSTELSASGTRSVLRWRGVLLAAEVAATVVLTLGAGLLSRSLTRLNGVDLGYDTERVMAMTTQLPVSRYPNSMARLRFFDAAAAGLHRIPGVRSVAYANQFPLIGGWSGRLQVESRNGWIDGAADLQAVNGDYYSTLGMRLLNGRLTGDADTPNTLPVAVVSKTFASRLAGDRDALGLRLRRNPSAPVITIVGVVDEIRRNGKLAAAEPQVYFPASQTNLYEATQLSALAVRADVDPRTLLTSIRKAVSAVDAAQTVTNIAGLDDIVSRSIATRRFDSWLLVSFAALALLLALVGIYGVVAHSVTQRTREIGIRMALGATRHNVVGFVVSGSLRWISLGLGLGLVGAMASSRVIASLLFETSPTDPATFVGVTLVIIGVALTASYLPARRAAGTNPVTALRVD